MSKILVVEDTLALHVVIRLSLESAGHSVELVDSVRSAIIKIEQHEFDLILLDYNLPDGCGDELLRYLDDKQLHTIPVIMMSGSMQKHTISNVFELGVKDYLIKPIGVDDLIYHVNQWLPSNVAH